MYLDDYFNVGLITSTLTLRRVKAWPQFTINKVQKNCTNDLGMKKKHDIKIKICKS